MERITKNNSTMENEVYKCLIENQIEYFYHEDDDYAKFIDSLDRKTYEKYLDIMVDEFYNEDVMWEDIYEHIDYNLFQNEIYLGDK